MRYTPVKLHQVLKTKEESNALTIKKSLKHHAKKLTRGGQDGSHTRSARASDEQGSLAAHGLI